MNKNTEHQPFNVVMKVALYLFGCFNNILTQVSELKK